MFMLEPQRKSGSYLQAITEQVNLYQSIAINDNYRFLIQSLENRVLAILSATENQGDNRWIIESEPINVDQASALSRDLNQQHYRFHIHNRRFHITAWNLLDAHYICNLIALHDLGQTDINDSKASVA